MSRLAGTLVGLVVALVPLACASLAPSSPGPRMGVWGVEGYDRIRWKARLVLEQREEQLAGYFEWESENGDRGVEHLVGEYVPKTRKVHLDGVELRNAVGSIMTSSYEATLSDDGQRLTDGRWGGFPGAPSGTWTAAWLGESRSWTEAASQRPARSNRNTDRADALRERIRRLEIRMDRVEAGFARLRLEN